MKDLLIILFLLLVSFPAVKSLLIPGGFTSHDLTHHVIRQISMNKILSEGQFPPRWSGELNNGYGYPVFLFNYPLPALIGEVFHKFGFGFVDSVKAVFLLSMIISILAMYLFLKEFLGHRLTAFLGAIFYLYAPIRFLNVYVSAAVGSALALAILPFIFWALVGIKKGKKWAVYLGALSLAGLILAHNVTTLIFAPVFLIFSGLLIWKSKESIKLFRQNVLMFLLGLGLSAWFWLPAVWEKQYIIFDTIYKDFYKDQFISIWQMLRSPWGYGLSHPQNPQTGDMSYQIGLIHILVVILLIPSLWYFRQIRAIGGFALVTFILSVFLMQKISLPLWENLPFLNLVQFPLRFSAIAVFSSSIAAAILVKYLPFRKVFFVTLLILVIYANRNHWRINQAFDPGENYYLSLKPTTASFNEHLPKWGRAMEREAPSKLEFIKGSGEIKVLEDKSVKFISEVKASTSSKLRFNQFYFPGWEIRIGNSKADFNYLEEGESYGLPVFEVSEGKHLIKAEFKNSFIRNVAASVSIITVIIVIVVILKSCKLLIRK